MWAAGLMSGEAAAGLFTVETHRNISRCLFLLLSAVVCSVITRWSNSLLPLLDQPHPCLATSPLPPLPPFPIKSILFTRNNKHSSQTEDG